MGSTTADDLARLILLLLVGAFFANLSRGTAGAWLRAKFLGTTTRRTTSTMPAPPVVLHGAAGGTLAGP